MGSAQHMLGELQVPFGGGFYNLVRWCAWTERSTGKVRLQVSCDVIFTKKWVPVKNIINSSSIEVTSLMHVMATHLSVT